MEALQPTTWLTGDVKTCSVQAVWNEVASLVAFVRPLAVVKKRWTQERLLLAIREYARFLLLKCRMEDGDGKVIAVPDDIAWVWKRHVLRDSAEYTRFNDKVGGHLGFVEFPPGPSGDRKGATWHLYRMAFDESPPVCIWQDAGPAAANAGRTTRHVGAAAVQTTPSPLMRGVAQAGPVRCASRTVLPGIFFELEGFSPDQSDQATAPLRAAGGPVIPPPRRRMPATRTLHPSRPRPHHRTQRTVPAPTANATGGSAPMVRPPNIPPRASYPSVPVANAARSQQQPRRHPTGQIRSGMRSQPVVPTGPTPRQYPRRQTAAAAGSAIVEPRPPPRSQPAPRASGAGLPPSHPEREASPSLLPADVMDACLNLPLLDAPLDLGSAHTPTPDLRGRGASAGSWPTPPRKTLPPTPGMGAPPNGGRPCPQRPAPYASTRADNAPPDAHAAGYLGFALTTARQVAANGHHPIPRDRDAQRDRFKPDRALHHRQDRYHPERHHQKRPYRRRNFNNDHAPNGFHPSGHHKNNFETHRGNSNRGRRGNRNHRGRGNNNRGHNNRGRWRHDDDGRNAPEPYYRGAPDGRRGHAPRTRTDSYAEPAPQHSTQPFHGRSRRDVHHANRERPAAWTPVEPNGAPPRHPTQPAHATPLEDTHRANLERAVPSTPVEAHGTRPPLHSTQPAREDVRRANPQRAAPSTPVEPNEACPPPLENESCTVDLHSGPALPQRLANHPGLANGTARPQGNGLPLAGQTVTVLASGNVKDIANAAPDTDSSNVKKAVTALAQGSAPAITEALKNAPIPPIPRSQPIAWLRKKTEVREDSSIECVTPVAKKPPAGSKSRPPLKKHIVRRSPAPDVLVVSEMKRKHTQKEQVPCPPIKKAKINPKGKQEETARNEMAHVIENARNSSPEPHAETHANAEIGRCKLPIQRIATPGEGKKAGPAAEAVKPAPKSRQLMRRRKDGVQKPTSQRDKSQEETSAARDKPASRRTCIDPKEDATVPRDRSPKNRDREVPSVKRPMRMTVSSVNSSVGTVKKSACEVRPGKILEESEDDDEVVEVEVTPQKQSPSSIIDVDLMNEDTSPVSKGRPPLPTPVGAVNKRNANARRLPRDPKPQDIVVGGLLKIWLRQSRLPGPTSGRGTAPSEKKEWVLMDGVKAYYSMSQVARRTLNELRSYKPLTEALGEYAERNILAWDVLYCGRDGREWPMTGESTFREELLRHGHMRKKMPALNVVVVTGPKKTTGRVPPSC